MKRNKRLLLKTAKRIEEVPESYNQFIWGGDDDSSPCGTVACLAGEIVICSEPTIKRGLAKLYKTMRTAEYVDGTAERLAGLTHAEGTRLFYNPTCWPNRIGVRFGSKGEKKRAEAAAALLRYLADGGKV